MKSQIINIIDPILFDKHQFFIIIKNIFPNQQYG